MFITLIMQTRYCLFAGQPRAFCIEHTAKKIGPSNKGGPYLFLAS